MSKTSPTQRTLAECKKRGWIAQVVERWNPYAKPHGKRIDLFGVIDIVAITPNGLVGIQATSGTNHSARIAKAVAEPRLAAWLGCGCTFEVWSWAKRGERGKRKVWQLREQSVSRADVSRETVA